MSVAAEPLMLIGARRRAALHDTLVSCVQAWRKEWTAAADPVRVLLAEEVEATCGRNVHGTCIAMKSDNHGKLAWAHAEQDALSGWLGVGGHAEHGSPGSHAIAREFQAEMLSALATALARRARVDDAVIEPTTGSGRPDRKARSVAVTIQMGSSRAKTTLQLTPRFAELLVPLRTAERASSAVSRRRPAIAEERVTVEAVLGDAEVSLRDLSELAIDDVIVLDRPLKAGGRLTMPDGTNVATVAIGRRGDRRAISINKRN